MIFGLYIAVVICFGLVGYFVNGATTGLIIASVGFVIPIIFIIKFALENDGIIKPRGKQAAFEKSLEEESKAFMEAFYAEPEEAEEKERLWEEARQKKWSALYTII